MGRPKIDDVMSCATTGSAPPAYLIDGLYVRYLHSFFLSSSLSLSFLVFSSALVKATRMAQPLGKQRTLVTTCYQRQRVSKVSRDEAVHRHY